MTFLGWKLSTGEVVKGYYITKEGKTSFEFHKDHTAFIQIAQHEANKLRHETGYKGKMVPQYQR